MEVTIKNCNNINNGTITLSKGRLNIKFGLNGAGKSTIARAIQHTVNEDEKRLDSLLPFRLRESNPNDEHPSVDGVGDIDSVMCFDEEYVAQFAFQQDELVKDSFHIFIKNEEYTKIQKEIELLMDGIKGKFNEGSELNKLITCLRMFSNMFKTTQGGLSKATSGMKALSEGNQLAYIPKELARYEQFIKSARNVEWADWHRRGYDIYSAVQKENLCPFCASDAICIDREHFDKIYKRAYVKNLTKLIALFDELGPYLTGDAQKKITGLAAQKKGLKREREDETLEDETHRCPTEYEELCSINDEVGSLLKKLDNLGCLKEVFDFKADADPNKVESRWSEEKLESYKFKDEDYLFFNSQETRKILGDLNVEIDKLINKVKGLVDHKMLHCGIKSAIENHEKDINKFLISVGYRYQVKVTGSGKNCRLQLQHQSCSKDYIRGGGQHLSYGERNALAVVLFMYHCLEKERGLIVLDDPMSSFDKTKKYAILHMLFGGDVGRCLKGKTVLMLTHDLEPIIDTMKSLNKLFTGQVEASYLRNSEGIISEMEIHGSDLMTFAEICKKLIFSSELHMLIKIHYLRRYFEIIGEHGTPYQLLLYLLKDCSCKQCIGIRAHTKECNEHYAALDINQTAIGEIKAQIRDFDPSKIIKDAPDASTPHNISDFKDIYKKSKNGYHKLQIVRYLVPHHKNPVIHKFINETYHIENEFAIQLNPEKFDLVPEYVIAECDKCVEEGIGACIFDNFFV